MSEIKLKTRDCRVIGLVSSISHVRVCTENNNSIDVIKFFPLPGKGRDQAEKPVVRTERFLRAVSAQSIAFSYLSRASVQPNVQRNVFGRGNADLSFLVCILLHERRDFLFCVLFQR